MTPKEKAEELYNKMRREEYHLAAKWCALIAVEECLGTCVESMIYYWVEVKHELNKSE